jgi:hypothetical protein
MYDDSSGSGFESPASGSLQLTIVSLAISVSDSDVQVNSVKLRRVYSLLSAGCTVQNRTRYTAFGVDF